MRDETLLVFLLRLAGSIMLLAFLAVFLPERWMAASHRWLGLGEFPASALVDYLTRSAAALYGVHGGLMWVLSRDIRRNRTVAEYIAVMNVVFGLLVVGIDAHAGLPLYWTLGEGPPVVVFGVVLLFLLRKVPSA